MPRVDSLAQRCRYLPVAATRQAGQWCDPNNAGSGAFGELWTEGPRLDFILIRLVEARNGWRGKQPIDEVIDAELDEIVAVANGHRPRPFASALSHGIQPAVIAATTTSGRCPRIGE